MLCQTVLRAPTRLGLGLSYFPSRILRIDRWRNRYVCRRCARRIDWRREQPTKCRRLFEGRLICGAIEFLAATFIVCHGRHSYSGSVKNSVTQERRVLSPGSTCSAVCGNAISTKLDRFKWLAREQFPVAAPLVCERVCPSLWRTRRNPSIFRARTQPI